MGLQLLPQAIRLRYEHYEWKHAAAILASDFPAEWDDLIGLLSQFQLKKSELLLRGGSKSKIAASLDSYLYAKGWQERHFDTAVTVDEFVYKSPTHKVDCYKNKVGIEVEWNNKDPFYDRDLNNFRLLFELRAVSVGVIITRSDNLDELFEPLIRSGTITGSRFGESTTHMSKLLPKIEGGGAGGCPLLVFGIGKACYVEDS